MTRGNEPTPDRIDRQPRPEGFALAQMELAAACRLDRRPQHLMQPESLPVDTYESPMVTYFIKQISEYTEHP